MATSQTMDEKYGDGSTHIVCDQCGFCINCGDCMCNTAMMTNDELASAIAYAFDRCDQKYIGGYTTGNTEPGKVMLEHLKSTAGSAARTSGNGDEL